MSVRYATGIFQTHPTKFNLVAAFARAFSIGELMTFSPNAQTIWADGPALVPSEPYKPDIRDWGTWLETIVNAFTSNGGNLSFFKNNFEAA